ncbi:hypothetical protein [Enterococcus sp. AZ102]|uniref:hypothetical protein n=1 Tax=Enterococcus sp. AZ102 TaxID=2774865 RepID=UPI003F260011
MTGQITKYENSKGYESISRDFLQDNSISFEARGLLGYLQSLPSDWKIYKTELYTRCESNKRASVDRIWKELLQANYLLQFRKRNGKKWEYQYIFSLVKFTESDKNKLTTTMNQENYMECGISTVENQQSKKDDKIKISSNVDFQQSKIDSPKSDVGMLNLSCSNPTSNKLTINRFEEEIKYNSNPAFSILKNSKLFTEQEIIQIINQLPNETNRLMINQQLQTMSQQSMILSPVKYFLNGIRKQIQFHEFKDNTEQEQAITELPKVTLHNWLEQA